MIQNNHIILKSDFELSRDRPKIKRLLAKANRFSFWRRHLSNQKSKLLLDRFSWEEWIKLPYITKKDFLIIGLEKRLKDAKRIIKKDTMHFLLQSTSGTSRFTGPVLFLKNVDQLVEGDGHEKGKRLLILYQGRAIALRDVIAPIRLCGFHKDDMRCSHIGSGDICSKFPLNLPLSLCNRYLNLPLILI